MQLPALEGAHKLGLGVVCFDAKADVLARPLADHFVVCDISQKDACLEAAKQATKQFPLHGVLTVGTDFSTTVAWVAVGLGLPGIPYEVAQRAKDKGLMRACFAENGVASPRYHVWTKEVGTDFQPSFGLPCVVKPADSMGARGVRLVTSNQELAVALDEASGHSPTGRVIVEQFIDGPEFSLDSIVRDGKLHRMGLADRHIVFSPYFVEIGHTLPSRFGPEVIESLWVEFEKGVRALGIRNGAAKGDVKLSSSGPMIGEIAARLSGGFMSGWTYPLSSGRDPTLWALETALGEPLTPQAEDKRSPVVERAWISIPGLLRNIGDLEAVRRIPGVAEVFVNLRPGQTMSFPRNNVEKAGNLICTGATFELAETSARRARNLLSLDLGPNQRLTDAFLADDDQPWWFEGAASCDPAHWWERSASEGWQDPYGNTVAELLRAAGLEADKANLSPRETRAYFKGGLQGLNYVRASQKSL